MLARLELSGYRGFERHSLEVRRLSAVVGYNNAGKSTIVEALRILSIVTERLAGLNLRDPPPWTDLPLVNRGVSPSLENLGIQFQTIANRYQDAPAEATATFVSGESIQVLLNSEGRCFAVVKDKDGRALRTKGQIRRTEFPVIQVLPQISPLEQAETVLNDDYVRRNLSSPLASRHFRNQLRLLRGSYLTFRSEAENSWPGIQVRHLEGANGQPGTELRLMVRDRDFVAEVGLMGHGLQMWLQTVWFLTRANPDATVVLDEPDVYMHPDLQRKLIRLVKEKCKQAIIATHSVEIVADLEPSEILVVDRTRRTSGFADTLPAVQSLVEKLGGIHNLHLARLWRSRRLILVEGDDLKFLKLAHDLLFPETNTPLDDIPNSAIGGWSGWPYAVGQSMLAHNSLGQKVRVYCILDSDYRVPEEIEERYHDAQARSVDLHVWSRKEIENYFLDPAIIARVVKSRRPELDEESLCDEIGELLVQETVALEDTVFDGYSASFRDRCPSGGVHKANRAARTLLDGVFREPYRALERVPGKEVLQRLSGLLHEHYGRGVSLREIILETRPSELSEEIRAVVSALERGTSFPNYGKFRERAA